MKCNKCGCDRFIIYKDIYVDKLSLYICKNKECANACMKLELEEDVNGK